MIYSNVTSESGNPRGYCTAGKSKERPPPFPRTDDSVPGHRTTTRCTECGTKVEFVLTGSHAGGTCAVAAAVLSVRRADADTVPQDGHHLARRLPRVDPGRRGRGADPRGRPPIRPRAGHHPVRHTGEPRARAVDNQVRRTRRG